MSITTPTPPALTLVFGYVYDNDVAVAGAKVTFTSPPFMLNDNMFSIEEEVETDSEGRYQASLVQTVATGTFVTVDIEFENSEGLDIHKTETIIVNTTTPASVQSQRASGTPTVVVTGGPQGPQGAAGIAGENAIETVAINTTLDSTHYTVLVNAVGGALTMTLPAAASSNKTTYVVKKIDTSNNGVTIDGSGAETIDGETTKILTGQYDSITMHCDGTSWFII